MTKSGFLGFYVGLAAARRTRLAESALPGTQKIERAAVNGIPGGDTSSPGATGGRESLFFL